MLSGSLANHRDISSSLLDIYVHAASLIDTLEQIQLMTRPDRIMKVTASI